MTLRGKLNTAHKYAEEVVILMKSLNHLQEYTWGYDLADINSRLTSIKDSLTKLEADLRAIADVEVSDV